jgi:hypothetical protein
VELLSSPNDSWQKISIALIEAEKGEAKRKVVTWPVFNNAVAGDAKYGQFCQFPQRFAFFKVKTTHKGFRVG